MKDSDWELCSAMYEAIVRRFQDDTPVWGFAPVERTVVLSWQTYGILENGGFEFLFGNDLPGDPDYGLTLEAFEAIGATKAANAIREARRLFSGGRPPTLLKQRRAEMEAMDPALLELFDERFYEDESIPKILVRFIEEHRSELPQVS